MTRSILPRPASLERELRELCELLAEMLDCQVNLTAACDLCAANAARATTRRLAADLASDLGQGLGFHLALSARCRLKPAYSELVRLACLSNRLGQALKDIAVRLARAQENRAALMSAMAYPAFLSLFSIGLLWGLSVYLFPRLSATFAEFGGQASTQLSLSLDSARQSLTSLAAILMVLGATSLVLVLARRLNPKFALWLDSLGLGLPFLGQCILEPQLRDFFYAMELQAHSGQGLLETLSMAASSSTNARFALGVAESAAALRRGLNPSEALGASGLFPPYALQWIKAAEGGGELAPAASRLCRHYEARCRRRDQTLLRAMEPTASLGAGLILLWSIFTFVLPVFKAMAGVLQ